MSLSRLALTQGMLLLTLLVAPVRSVLAIPPFWEQFEATYVAGNENKESADLFRKTKCNVCHEGDDKKKRNPFGVQLSKLLAKDNFKKERLAKEKEAAVKEILAAFEKVAAIKADPAKEASPTFGELLAQGKLPGKPIEVEAAPEESAPERKPTKASGTDVGKAGLIAQLIDELVAEQLAVQRKALKAELKAELKSEMKASLAPQLLVLLKHDLKGHDPEAEKEAIAKIEEIGGTVRPIAMNDDSREVDFHLGGKELTDEEVKLVNDLGQVIHLHLQNTKITDAGLAHVGGIPTLKRLHLEQTGITDEGLAHLKGLGELEYLNVYGTEITDKGLDHLRGLDNLKKLYIWQTKVTIPGTKKLQQLLPNVEIIPDLELEKKRAAELAIAKAAAEKKAAEEKAAAEKKAAEEKAAAEKKAAEEKAAADKKAAEEKAAAEKKAAEEKTAAEKKAAEEKAAAEKKSDEKKAEEPKKAEGEKVAETAAEKKSDP